MCVSAVWAPTVVHWFVYVYQVVNIQCFCVGGVLELLDICHWLQLGYSLTCHRGTVELKGIVYHFGI